MWGNFQHQCDHAVAAELVLVGFGVLHDLKPLFYGEFAFLDGDLYTSIKTSLKLVENRMAKDGIIIVHDYNNPELPGSSRAVDEWLKAHPGKTLEVKETLAIIR